jgi:hypothetical protein
VELYTAQARWVADHILNNFLAATPSDTGQCRGTPTIGGTPPRDVPFHRSPDTHDGEMRLAKHDCDCVCTALSKCLRNYSCAQYSTCYVGGNRPREKLGMPMRAYSYSSLLLPRQNHQPATFPSPAAENVQRSAPPHITSAKHQPNTIWQNHLRLSSFRLSVVWHDFQPMLSSFLPFFHPQCSIPQHVQK